MCYQLQWQAALPATSPAALPEAHGSTITWLLQRPASAVLASALQRLQSSQHAQPCTWLAHTDAAGLAAASHSRQHHGATAAALFALAKVAAAESHVVQHTPLTTSPATPRPAALAQAPHARQLLSAHGAQLHAGRLHAPKLLPGMPAHQHPSRASAPQRLAELGGITVTGAAGGLGQLVSIWLAQAGAQHVQLLSRSAHGLHMGAAAGCWGQVHVTACDIATRRDAAWSMAQLSARSASRAVLHAAGVLRDAVLSRQSLAGLRQVLAPKLSGAVRLQERTSAVPLAACVLFSSIAGLLGSAGQASYAAANAFLDGWSEQQEGMVGPLAAGLSSLVPVQSMQCRMLMAWCAA